MIRSSIVLSFDHMICIEVDDHMCINMYEPSRQIKAGER